MEISEKILLLVTGINEYNVIMFMLNGGFKVKDVKSG